MIPRGTEYPSNLYYEFARLIPRTPVRLLPADFFMDYYGDTTDHEPYGDYGSISYITNDTPPDTVYKYVTYAQRHYFETHPDCSGCDTVTIGGTSYPAAHHKLDYIRIWDVPPYVKIPDFPY